MAWHSRTIPTEYAGVELIEYLCCFSSGTHSTSTELNEGLLEIALATCLGMAQSSVSKMWQYWQLRHFAEHLTGESVDADTSALQAAGGR
jgi:hypothetical protein